MGIMWTNVMQHVQIDSQCGNWVKLRAQNHWHVVRGVSEGIAHANRNRSYHPTLGAQESPPSNTHNMQHDVCT